MNLIKEIEGADPNDELDEDENGLNWGHRIFSHRLGNLSWQDIGSTVVACRLIAAVVKTCNQARQVCAKLGIRGSYISDSYLDRVIDILREKWDEEGSVSLINSFLIQVSLMKLVSAEQRINTGPTQPVACINGHTRWISSGSNNRF